MSIRSIDNTFSVTGQIKQADIPAIADAGYVAIVCMRPDREGFFQPAFDEIRAAAEARNLAAHYLPVIPGSMPVDAAKQLKQILRETEGPILAYCASGNRCTMVYQMAQQAGG
jgi:uncharacterized protein (TIGR01244 family)